MCISSYEDLANYVACIQTADPVDISSGEASVVPDRTNELEASIKEAVNHRRLNPRQIQLTAMAGSIGAALFVAIGSGVLSGPLCLLVAFIFWATVVFSIAQCRESTMRVLNAQQC